MAGAVDAVAAAAPGLSPRPAAESPADLLMMTMNSLAESLLGPPDPSKAAFLDFGLGPPSSPHQQPQSSQPQQHPTTLAATYSLQALHPLPPPPQQTPLDSGVFSPPAASYGSRPLAYPPYPGAAGGSPHAFYHHHHHGTSYSTYQQNSNTLSHGTRLEETGKGRLVSLGEGAGGKPGATNPPPPNSGEGVAISVILS